MIRAFSHRDGRLAPPEDAPNRTAVWIDLLSPSGAELDRVGAHVGAALPTRADMEEIEQSSRVYQENGVRVLTLILPTRSDDGSVGTGPVTFVLAGETLVTIRYHEPRPFATYPERAGRSAAGCASAEAVLHGLLEDIVDRLADILEVIGREVDQLSRRVFRAEPGAARDLAGALTTIGREGDLLGDIRMSLLTIERALSFLGQSEAGPEAAPEIAAALRTQTTDVRSLAEHAGFLAQKMTLLLEATLGLITIEQNATIKIFTVVAVIFMPPTLIASIYGMNFAAMPELGWALGYPFALLLMVGSAAATYWVFRRKGWL